MLPLIEALEMHIYGMIFSLPSSKSCPLASELEPLKKNSQNSTISCRYERKRLGSESTAAQVQLRQKFDC